MPRYEEALVSALLTLMRELRKSQGLTLEGLADRAGVHRTMVGLLEREERHPSVSLAVQLAVALGVPLSNLLKQAEDIVGDSADSTTGAIRDTSVREAQPEHFHHADVFYNLTGLTTESLQQAIDSCHYTLDIIDAQLMANGSPPIAKLVELANLSSMIGNLIGAALASASDGLYKRNRPHAYPDLVPQQASAVNLEIKLALEANLPKGHLPKEGMYIAFRYVLGTRDGIYTRGKEHRGDTAWIWEARVGHLSIDDISISNTPGDSGESAVIRRKAFDAMSQVYFVPGLSPLGKKRNTVQKRLDLI